MGDHHHGDPRVPALHRRSLCGNGLRHTRLGGPLARPLRPAPAAALLKIPCRSAAVPRVAVAGRAADNTSNTPAPPPSAEDGRSDIAAKGTAMVDSFGSQ